MAHTVSAHKRIRQNASHRARNRWRKRMLREAVKDVREQIIHGSTTDAENSFRKAQAIIDRVAGKGVIHKKAAARTKSRLSAHILAKKQAG